MSQALQCYIGGLPTQKLAKIQLTIMCELAGPNTESGTPISTGNASWRGPTQKLEHQFLQAMKLGETEINFAKISFCLTPFIISVPIRDVKILRKNNATNQVYSVNV